MSITTKSQLVAGIEASLLQEHRDGYDRACKRLLSEKVILGWILHECLDEYKDVDPLVIADTLIEGTPELGTTPVHRDDAAASRVIGLDTEDSSIGEGTVRYDIRFFALLPDGGERIGMIVNVEAQGVFRPGYSLLQRGSYYCARMISAQYGRVFTEPHYEKIQKVCSIWVCPNPPSSFRNTVTRYAMAEENLVGQAHSERDSYDLMEMVLVCPDGDRQEAGDGILRLLGTLIASEKDVETRKTILSDEFGIPMSEQLSDEVTEVGSFLSKGLEDRAYARGLEAGIAEGIDQGISQGIEQGVQQGIEQGIEQGVKQGIELGIQQGIEQGVKQGIELGIEQENALMAQLFEALQARGRLDEMGKALQNSDVRSKLLEEFGLGLTKTN